MRTLLCLLLTSAVATADDPWTLDDDFKAAKPEDLKDVAPTPAPPNAVVLFDGTSVDAWTKKNGKDAVEWKLKDGMMEGVKGHGDIITKEKFAGPFKLHAEFRVPYVPNGKGQGRGNSGIYVQGRYEVQVLDSYGLQSGKNDCAAIYDIHPPKVNACKAPTVWQSFDIDFTPPKFEDGKKTEPARMTVHHNGVLVHEDAPIPLDNTRAGMGGDPSKPGPILLQDHGHPVQYRNIWLVK